MGKIELNIYNNETGELQKTYQRQFIPVKLFLRFQKIAEKIIADKIENNEAVYKSLEPLFLEAFPSLTSAEYYGNVDVAEVLRVFNHIVTESIKNG